ncbi:MAG: hypothetical protein AAGG11_20160 [Pseudomonadota bacterium]
MTGKRNKLQVIALRWRQAAHQASRALARVEAQRCELQEQRDRLLTLQSEYREQRSDPEPSSALQLRSLGELIDQISEAVATIDQQLEQNAPMLDQARDRVAHWERKLLGIERRDASLAAQARAETRRRENRQSSATLKVSPRNGTPTLP